MSPSFMGAQRQGNCYYYISQAARNLSLNTNAVFKKLTLDSNKAWKPILDSPCFPTFMLPTNPLSGTKTWICHGINTDSDSSKQGKNVSNTMLGKKTEPSDLSSLTQKQVSHSPYICSEGWIRNSAPYRHLGTQNDGGSTICDSSNHKVRGRDTLENHAGALQCLSLDISHAPAKCKRARK